MENPSKTKLEFVTRSKIDANEVTRSMNEGNINSISLISNEHESQCGNSLVMKLKSISGRPQPAPKKIHYSSRNPREMPGTIWIGRGWGRIYGVDCHRSPHYRRLLAWAFQYSANEGVIILMGPESYCTVLPGKLSRAFYQGTGPRPRLGKVTKTHYTHPGEQRIYLVFWLQTVLYWFCRSRSRFFGSVITNAIVNA